MKITVGQGVPVDVTELGLGIFRLWPRGWTKPVLGFGLEQTLNQLAGFEKSGYDVSVGREVVNDYFQGRLRSNE